MNVVVFGASGTIGRKLVELLRAQGHDARTASPSAGVDSLTGRGLLEVLQDAQVVVDVSRSRASEQGAVDEFYQRSTRHMLASAIAANVGHYLALTPDAEHATAALLTSAAIPFTVVSAKSNLGSTDGMARALATLAVGPPRNGTLELEP